MATASARVNDVIAPEITGRRRPVRLVNVAAAGLPALALLGRRPSAPRAKRVTPDLR